MLWESLWYWVFQGLHGKERTLEEAGVRRNILASYRDALKEARAELAHRKEEGSDADVWQFHADQLAADVESEERSRRREREVAEPRVWKRLVRARTAQQVRQACRQSKRWLNPEWRGRDFVRLLSEEADQFVKAKDDHFYPRAPYPSSDRKRVTFFARAMAGISCDLSPSTAVGRLRKMKHGDKCPCVNCNSRKWQRIYEAMYTTLEKGKKKRRKKP